MGVGNVLGSMGGALALGAAVRNPAGTLQAVSCFYGTPPKSKADPSTIRTSVTIQCHFANKDQGKGFADKEVHARHRTF